MMHPCDDCQHPEIHAPNTLKRRDFVRAAAGAAITSLGALGVSAPDAFAFPILSLTPLAPDGGDRAQEKRYPIPAADSVLIDRENSVIVARAHGKVYAFVLSCPHQNTTLRWNEGDREFQCPKHKSRYRADGTFIEGRATRAMDRLAVKRDGATLVVDVDLFYRQDEQPKEWGEAYVTL